MHDLRGTVRNDRASLLALDSLIDGIRSANASGLRKSYTGWVEMLAVTFQDSNTDSDGGAYFQVGTTGVQASSVRIRENPTGIWVMSDRWADSLIISIDPALRIEDANIIPDEWDEP